MTGISVISSAANAEDALRDLAADDVQQTARTRLKTHAELWRHRPLLREIYRGYHEVIFRARSPVSGLDLEVGAGHGSFAEFHPGVLSCDIVPCPWLDCAADAARLPFADAALANIIMIDVLHHLADPARFLAEGRRVLKPGGRILMIEPYVSPLSWIAWNYFHDEDVNMRAQPLAGKQKGASNNPWSANTAIPTLLFWRDLAAFKERFPQLAVIRRERFDLLLYPLSGGFERPQLLPQILAPLVRSGERLLKPLASLLAFRCFLVLEKSSS